MGLFNRKDEPVIIRKPHRKKGASELLQKQYIKTLKEMPELRTALALKAAGNLDEYEKYTDPAKIRRKEIEKVISDEAMALIKQDPNLKKELATLAARNILESGGSNGDVDVSLTPAGQLLKTVREMRELQEELGMDTSKSISGWSSAIQQMIGEPEMSKTVAMFLRQLISPQNQSVIEKTVSQRKYVVMVDDKLTELTEPQYTDFVKKGRIKPIGLIEQPKQETKKLELPDWAKEFQFDKLESYLELTPEDFVNKLKTESENESAPQLRVFLDFLSKTDTDTVLKILEPYKDNEIAGKFVSKLIMPENRDWIDKVIDLVKGVDSEVNIGK